MTTQNVSMRNVLEAGPISVSIGALVGFVCLAPLNACAQAESLEASDGRIRVVVDTLYRSDSFPSHLFGPQATAPAPQPRHSYYVISVAVLAIQDGHVFGKFDRMQEDTELSSVSADGSQVNSKVLALAFSGASLRDSHDVNSGIQLTEGATLTLVFEAPALATPSELTLTYAFGASWDDYEAPAYHVIGMKVPEISAGT